MSSIEEGGPGAVACVSVRCEGAKESEDWRHRERAVVCFVYKIYFVACVCILFLFFAYVPQFYSVGKHATTCGVSFSYPLSFLLGSTTPFKYLYSKRQQHTAASGVAFSILIARTSGQHYHSFFHPLWRQRRQRRAAIVFPVSFCFRPSENA